jgi:molybdate transport system substrate-binding protein
MFARKIQLFGIFLAVIAWIPPLSAEEIMAAVAANFTAPFKQLIAEFERESGHKVIPAFGSTGKLYTEITQDGAPYDVFFAANMEHPRKLVEADQAVADSLFPYARGKLALWSKEAGRVDPQGKILEQGNFKKLAFPEPENAPYGVAAEQVLKKLGLGGKLNDKIVKTETLTHAYNLVATGKADLAFLALSQLKEGEAPGGSVWEVPASMHDPIEQGAVILKIAEDREAVKAFMTFMRTPQANSIIEAYGYAQAK